jgi:hypothetical protein
MENTHYGYAHAGDHRMLRWKRRLILALLGGVLTLSPKNSAHGAESIRQFSTVGPWAVLKKQDGTCFAFANGYQGDVFLLWAKHSGVYVSLGNSAFNIPRGEYPVELSLNGSTIVPADVTTMTAVVKEGKGSWLTVKLLDHQIKNLPRAALITVSLAGKSHLLFLSDIGNLMRDLDTCAKYDSDPLRSAR